MTIDSHVEKDYKFFNKDGIIPEDSILSTKYSVSNPSPNTLD